MNYHYYICDVFTSARFSGNPLAVLPHADGLSSAQMQQIAREFNFSESTFVLPAEQGHTRRVRIFTPTTEVDFAGHPNIGTAFVLASSGELGDIDDTTTITFEEAAGLVPVKIENRAGSVMCELEAPQPLSLGEAVTVQFIADALHLNADDISTAVHPPQEASVGLPFLLVELRNRQALENARIDAGKLETLSGMGISPDIHAYTHSDDDFDIRARMFAPLDGVPEDPATGSANCALAAMLTHFSSESSGAFSWRIAQGVEMGRPSVLDARTEKREGAVTSTWIGGETVMVSEGELYLD